MKKNLVIILIIILALTSGCISKKKCAKYYPPQRDSVLIIKTETIEKLRDTTIYISDSSQTQAKLITDTAGVISIASIKTKEGNLLASPKLVIRENIIYADCIIDSAAVYMALKDRYTVTSSESKVTETITVEVNKLKWWQTGLMIIGFATIVFIGIRKIIK